MREFPKTVGFAVSLLVVVTLVAIAMIPDKPLRLTTQVYPPYQDFIGDEITGSSVDVMKCALDAVGHPYTIDIVRGQEWATAQARVKAGDADGFFGALHTQSRDEYAVWSNAIDLNKTYFIKLRDNPILRQDHKAKWGVKKGSGISAQIEGTTLNVGYYAEDNPELVMALFSGKIDFIYMDISILRWGVRSNDITDGVLHAVVRSPDYTFDTTYFNLEPVADQLYGAYISRAWLGRHPGYMDRLNAAIGACRQREELK